MNYNIHTVSNEKEGLNEIARINKVIIVLFGFLFVFLPLITRVQVAEFISPLISFHSSLNSGSYGELFTYYKFLFFLIVTFVILLLFLYSLFITKAVIKPSNLNIFISIFVFSLLISLIFAPYKEVALFGMYNRHDGTITYLGYMALLFVAANLSYKAKHIHLIVLCLIPPIFVNAIMGLVTFYGIDLGSYSWVQNLIVPTSLREVGDIEGSGLSTTLNHGNYASGFAGMVVVLATIFAMMTKNKWMKVVYSLLAIFAFSMIFTSLSRSGFVAVTVSLPIIAFVIWKSKQKLEAVIPFVSIVILSTALFIPLVNHNAEVWDRTVGFFVGTNPFVSEEASESSMNPTDLLTNIGGSLVPSVQADEPNENNPFELEPLPERGVGAGAGRLFIWDRTFDLIKERPLFGYGMDTLALFFPQNDPEIYANIENYHLVVDKPHNMYIGIGYGAGIIALISFLALVGIHVYRNIVYFMKGKLVTEEEFLLVALFGGLFAYLVQAVFNDTIIGSAPIFFVLFGVSVALLREVKNHQSA
ncbi:hypothetical protein JCM9140_2304 [Halalkalibacter wakoensis JCM 9140]|uniref:O-antigen ligase-related domain-containing protein n=1 Tax=Halalkalibacter wakoensis JCM 9140 TaxID=1236970 RepID=W4Q2E7_9BACI|nr:O-antigen ligase family protein [Halalkalibacter wakoensis]GAE26256.1 hypothetical protein JCM9140_2304 [Halalkalibacter wakoensis JCM 9140]